MDTNELHKTKLRYFFILNGNGVNYNDFVKMIRQQSLVNQEVLGSRLRLSYWKPTSENLNERETALPNEYFYFWKMGGVDYLEKLRWVEKCERIFRCYLFFLFDASEKLFQIFF